MNFLSATGALRNLFPMVAVAFSQLLVVAYTISGPPSHPFARPTSVRRARLPSPRCDLAELASNQLLAAGAGVTLPVLAVLARDAASSEIGAPYPPRADAYDPLAADRFYGARPLVVLSRIVKLTFLTGAFNAALLLDFLAYKRAGAPEGEPWPNEGDRAKEALALATQLGPTFIKLAQALSIRTDLIPESYALELRQLQDAVPPFDSARAKDIIARELDVPGGAAGLSALFTRLTAEPVAAASIGQVQHGELDIPVTRTLTRTRTRTRASHRPPTTLPLPQVYRGELLDGKAVAVKVQRPAILDAIALDLHILRLLAPLQVSQ